MFFINMAKALALESYNCLQELEPKGRINGGHTSSEGGINQESGPSFNNLDDKCKETSVLSGIAI